MKSQLRPQAPLWSRHLWRWPSRLWPQVPLGIFLLGSGALNVSAGLHTDVLSYLLPNSVAAAVPDFSQQISYSALGSGAQAILGAALLLSGVGLFWRMRFAWAFSLRRLLIVIGVNLANGHVGAALIVPGIAAALLIAFGRRFTRQTLFGSTLISLTGVFAVFAYGTFGLYLFGDQFDPHIQSLITALYFTVETLATVGYGDFHPVTQLAQVYVITLIVFGLSVFATAIFSIVGPALTLRLERLFTTNGETIVKRDHVIIVGAGVIARNTAHELVRRGVPFVQVVGVGIKAPLPDQPFISGDMSDDAVLVKAGIGKAYMLVAADDDDGENAFIALAAKDLNPKTCVLAVASSRRAIRRLKLPRADMVFAPAEVGSRLLARLVEGEALPEEFQDLFNGDRTQD